MKLNEIHIHLPIAFDIIRDALSSGKMVTFKSWYSGHGGTGVLFGRVLSLELVKGRMVMTYNEWVSRTQEWDTSKDSTTFSEAEMEEAEVGESFQGSDLHLIIPNHEET